MYIPENKKKRKTKTKKSKTKTIMQPVESVIGIQRPECGEQCNV